MYNMWSKIVKFFKANWIIILILCVAVFLRFYKLDSIPFGLYPDEAANGQDVIRMIDNGDHRAIYDTNGPRESLFIYFQGLFVWIGQTFNIKALFFTPLALRIAPAIIGVITVFGIYLLAKELFNKNIGLLAASTLAVSAWHIQFSRNGFRAVMLPMALCFIFYFFIRAYREGKLKDYLWFGVFLAMGFYTYLSIRMVPLVFGAFIVWTFFFDKKFFKKNIKNILYAGGIFMLLMVPMFISFVKDPSLIAGRASTSIFNPELNNGSWFGALINSITKEITMFNFAGDANFRHNLGGSPMLDMITGIFFWVGFVYSLLKIKKIEHFLLLTLFGAMSLPMVLTAEGIPHALRLVGAIPVVFIWIALGINFVVEKINNKNVKYIVLGLILIIAGGLGFKKYFIDFPTYTEAREAYSEDMVVMADDIKNSSSERINYMITGEFGLKTVDYMTHGSKPEIIQYETYEIVDNFKVTGDNYKIFVTPNWLKDADKAFLMSGYYFDFKPVKSDLDGRILYYEYSNK